MRELTRPFPPRGRLFVFERQSSKSGVFCVCSVFYANVYRIQKRLLVR